MQRQLDRGRSHAGDELATLVGNSQPWEAAAMTAREKSTSASVNASTAAALVIGNELLSGKVQDANLQALCSTLRALGIELARAVFTRDDPGAIARDVAELSAAHDLVVTSGGVGPTHDDVTVDAVASALGVEVVQHPDLARLIRGFYGERTTDVHLRMARVPTGARLLSTPDVAWPAIVARNVWLMPGIPEIFRLKLAILRAHVRGPADIFGRAVYCRADEVELQPFFDVVGQRFPSVEIGSYPNWSRESFRTKVTFDGRRAEDVDGAVAAFLDLVPPDGVIRSE